VREGESWKRYEQKNKGRKGEGGETKELRKKICLERKEKHTLGGGGRTQC
jgi:hypothetical protein